MANQKHWFSIDRQRGVGGCGKFSRMKSCLILGWLVPHLVWAQELLVPAWRGTAGAEHAEWNVFTSAVPGQGNVPDVGRIPADNGALLFCTTNNAFIASGGNIYSFSGAISLQVIDTFAAPIRNVVLQVKTLGAELDPESVELRGLDLGSAAVRSRPDRAFETFRGSVTNDFGTSSVVVRVFQWDLRARPLTGTFGVVFNAATSSMSLDRVALDVSSNFEEVRVPEAGRPRLGVEAVAEAIVLSWPESAGGVVETNDDPGDPSGWVPVSGVPTAQAGVLRLELPRSAPAAFFRLNY